MKAKLNVAGCFRSLQGGRNSVSIASYLSTGRKHGVDPYKAILAAFGGQSRIVLKRS